MSGSAYTLLIVESPVLARVIQKYTPSPVYVLATGGFCWRPVYDPSTHQLKATADPQKKEIRKELKTQAAMAARVVIATDHDPSGDFIAWSIARYLKQTGLKRGSLQNISRSGILQTLEQAPFLDEVALENRLKNQFLIHHLWNCESRLPDRSDAGLAAIFSATQNFQTFVDRQMNMYRSTQAISCPPDEWIGVSNHHDNIYHHNAAPLSLFDLVPSVKFKNQGDSFGNAQFLIRQLFETQPFYHNQSLISYPRTATNAFYSETWRNFSEQYIKYGHLNDLKPTFLQQIANSDSPHESIHPLDLSATPNHIQGELPGKVSEVYELIYNHTLSAIRMPEPLSQSWENDFYPEIGFYRVGNHTANPNALRPVITLSELGKMGHTLGITKPSSFGTDIDSWLETDRIRIKNGVLEPGKKIIPLLSEAPALRKTLMELSKFSHRIELTPETVKAVFTS